MNIGIIGAGFIGGGLAKKLVGLGHDVSIANSRGPASLEAVSKETGAHAKTVTEVVKGVDVVIIAITEKSIPLLPGGLFRDIPKNVVIADTGNYYPARDGRIEEIESGLTESGWVAKVLGRPVVKVFNNILAQSVVASGLPKGAPDRIALPVAGDDAHAKAVISELVDALGFTPFDGGTLAESWRQQPGTPIYCADFDLEAATRALGAAVRSEAPARRDRSWNEFVANPGLSHAELVKRIRALA